MSDVSIGQSRASSNVYQITGASQFKNVQLTFRAGEIVMAEMVRLRKHDHGRFEISILDYDAARLEWAHWSGIAYADVSRVNEGTPYLERTVIHIHQLPAKQVPESLAGLATIGKANDKFVSCPDCKANVKLANLRRHLRVVHNHTPLAINQVLAGKLV